MTLRAALCLVVVFALPGCDRMKRVSECRRLSGLVNPKLTEIEGLAKKGTAADYRAAARGYGVLAKEVRQSATTTSANGKALTEEYATVLDSVAPAVSAHAVALEKQDAQQLEESRRSIDRLAKRQQGMAARVDAYCLAP